MASFPVPGFTGSPLARVDIERDRPAWFEDQRADPAARLLRLDGLKPVLDEDGRLSWGPLSEAPAGVGLALLGLIDGAPRFVALTASPAEGDQRGESIAIARTMTEPGASATYAAARSLVDWHARHRFCANCGRPTGVARSGWARFCLAVEGGCGAEHFPRTDPVVIMLAEHEGRVLLGRNIRAPNGFYSALAGFLEVGESIEEAVARELNEEAGVVVTGVRYVTSQPWPFPSQLMIACIATVESDALTLDTNELGDALWATKDEVRAALAGDPGTAFRVPFPIAIAHTLLTAWVNGA
ncbi:NAD(+) diphosphatase [Rhizorhabdus wittichii]|uniref:NAD(+) diphosphatase n=1 Tax=Rhizorhabdus wittichii TaxID=160791 RepID=A0A975HFF3_9SPHN|nr:NAD(+) diphosphatase [Rhizorhabdus wittichii]QTH23491.1 NAD(+) diphosphatase [Rhizorhabdus wittichii]